MRNMEKQDEIRKELFDYLQRELSKERIDIRAKRLIGQFNSLVTNSR